MIFCLKFHRFLTQKIDFESTIWHFLTNHNSLQDCFKKNPLSMLILGQKSCILGPTIFICNSTTELTAERVSRNAYEGEFIIFLRRFVIASQSFFFRQFSCSSLPLPFFLDYTAPLKSCIPKIAVSQLSWALKFHSKTRLNEVA